MEGWDNGGIQGTIPGLTSMQTAKILLAILTLAAGCATGFGRIGENAQDLQKRYGAPTSADTVGAYQRAVYEKSGFEITVYYSNGSSVMEIFAGRFDQAVARKLAVQVAGVAGGGTFAEADACHEAALRKDSGITSADDVFWLWTAAGSPMTAAFNPVECTLTFFSKATLYADIHKALASQPM